MASKPDEQKLQGSIAAPLSPSLESISGQENQTPGKEPSRPPTRSPNIRFADDHQAESSLMSQGRASRDSDEITPIKTADGHANRSYNTSSQSQVKSTNRAKPTTTENAGEQELGKSSWFKRIADKYGPITLDNKGSVARDHLALERTFLAWLRTSLAFASIGIAVTQLFRLNKSIQTSQQSSASLSQSPLLPLSPLLGHGLPPELVPVLQQLAQATAQALPTPTAANTLLDQLLLMAYTDNARQPLLHEQAFDEQAAAKLRRVGKPLGATFIGISIVVLLIGFHRYFEAQYWIIRGKFPASRGSVALIGLIAGALIVASLIVVLAIAPSSYEKR